MKNDITINDEPTLSVHVPFTAFPNVLLDEIMPQLKDTEWRVLCVIVRQTLGWSDGKGGRKRRDWLSQRQLMARTGRNSAALSAAIDALVRRRLVDAWDEAGELVLTSQQRRAHAGKIYYGLCSGSEDLRERKKTPQKKSPLRKANTTKEIEDKRNLFKGTALEKRRQTAVAVMPRSEWAQASQIAAGRFDVNRDEAL